MPVFGVPSQRRSTKVEKYATPVATTVIAEEKKARSIMFNEAAVTAFGLTDDSATVAFSFENGIFVFNANNPAIPEEYKINVTKLEPRKISDKKTYEYIMKKLELDDQVENEFDLIATTVDGIAAFELVVKTGVTEAVKDKNLSDQEVEFEAVEASVDSEDDVQVEEPIRTEADPFAPVTQETQNVTVD